MMKKTIVTLRLLRTRCAAGICLKRVRLIKNKTTTEEPITVTGKIIKTTTEEGAAANYQPVKTLVVREDRSNNPGTYVLDGPGHIVNRQGELVLTAIKPGTRVRVYYVNTGDLRVIDHVVVD